ncbi:MAG: hypothetical protein KJ052_11085 [Candidatus Hydrogenedentes bacterium]|nr:hypothetical protein [Candidatus Hydrogenedentota bacterium]
MRQWFAIISRVLFIIAILNFTAFFIVSLQLGGDAINGKIEDGHYFLASKGNYTEVSPAIFNYSRAHVYSVFATTALLFISAGMEMLVSKRD